MSMTALHVLAAAATAVLALPVFAAADKEAAAKTYGDIDDNPLHTANVIANKEPRNGGPIIIASVIDWHLLRKLHEVGGVEANVATGYHAIAPC